MDDVIGPTVLMLDAILTGPIDSPERQALIALGDMIPGLRDQVRAAVNEADQRVAVGLAAGVYTGVRPLAALQHPAWVRLGALDTLVAWLAGMGSTCTHDPHPTRPQPLVAGAWKPRLVVCLKCTHLLRVGLTADTDRTCDGCGRVVAGLDGGDPIYPSALHVSVLQYGFGVCADCRY